MTQIRLILLIVSLLLLLFIVAMLLPEPTLSHGESHDQFPEAMQRGGDGTRHSSSFWFGATIAILEVLLFVVLLSLGLGRVEKSRKALLSAGFVYLSCTLAMLATYWMYIPVDPTEPVRIVLGLPIATAWMVYGVGLSPLLFMLLYVVQFNTWVLTPEQEERLRQIVSSASDSSIEVDG